MWCTVHVLYEKGRRIPAGAAKANGVYGWLYMRSKTPVVGMPQPEAFLLRDPDGNPGRPMLHLENCSLRAIVGGGIRLVGFDMHLASQPAVWQSWWIIPGGAAVIHTYPTLLRTPNPHYDWPMEHVLPGLPADYTVFEVFPGRFTVRDARCRCVYFGPGPVEVVRSRAPF